MTFTVKNYLLEELQGNLQRRFRFSMPMDTMLRNYDLRDEIKAYWSIRAETFDTQPGHEIFSEEERAAWHAMLRKHLGDGGGRSALDLACGTAVVCHLLDDLGFNVAGLDWSEAMLERARSKAAKRGRKIRFLVGDAEHTMEPDNAYDVITNRHLVWTLVDPAACFREWHRVLKPNGRLLIIDGDFVNPTLVSRVVKRLSKLLSRIGCGGQDQHGPATAALARTHQDILSRVYFSQGARAEAVVALLREAGFRTITVDTDLRAVHRAQKRHFDFLKGLERGAQHRYVICAEK